MSLSTIQGRISECGGIVLFIASTPRMILTVAVSRARMPRSQLHFIFHVGYVIPTSALSLRVISASAPADLVHIIRLHSR
jgi:hypothetical protein